MQVQCSISVDPDGNALPGDQQSKRKQSAACICCEKSDKASDQTRAGSQILLGMSDQIYRSKKVLGFWSVSSSCRSVPSDFWRTQKIGPELGDYWPAFTVFGRAMSTISCKKWHWHACRWSDDRRHATLVCVSSCSGVTIYSSRTKETF